MSENVIDVPDLKEPPGDPGSKEESTQDWLKAVMSSEAFYPGLALAVGFAAIFWPVLIQLPHLWFGDDGYYSHGILVPLISGYMVYRKWPEIKDRKVQPFYPAIIPLLFFLWISTASLITDVKLGSSLGLVGTMLSGILLVSGYQWLKALAIPALYTFFALPVWAILINAFTNPLQILSTKVSFQMLKLVGLNPIRGESGDVTTIYLPKFILDVGVPCSGMKLVIAVTAFTVFFVVIGGLRWWANLIMIALILPLCVAINALRITLIGIVGNQYGNEAGHQFHDYSGYITLIVCFFLLFKTARLLGWKD